MASPTKQAQQDRKAGLLQGRQGKGGRFVALYDDDTAIAILERLANGELLRDICSEPGMPHPATFRRWVVNTPKLAMAFDAAVRLSAVSLEEEALAGAREVKRKSKTLTGTEVRAYEVALNQFRWSASRRDPTKFGERAPANITVPIQINTNLDLGGNVDDGNIYTLSARVPDPQPATHTPDPEETLIPDPKPWNPHAPRKRQLTPPRPATSPATEDVPARAQEDNSDKGS